MATDFILKPILSFLLLVGKTFKFVFNKYLQKNFIPPLRFPLLGPPIFKRILF